MFLNNWINFLAHWLSQNWNWFVYLFRILKLSKIPLPPIFALWQHFMQMSCSFSPSFLCPLLSRAFYLIGCRQILGHPFIFDKCMCQNQVLAIMLPQLDPSNYIQITRTEVSSVRGDKWAVTILPSCSCQLICV